MWIPKPCRAAPHRDTTRRFRQGYFNSPVYKRIFRILNINNKIKNATRIGVNFKLIKGLLYHIIKDRTRRLYIPKSIQDFILTMAYNNQHHTRLHRTLRHLNGFHFRHKKKLAKAWIHGYQACVLNQTDRHRLPREIQPIQISKTPMHTITINWILTYQYNCNNSGYECCGRKEGRNNRKEYHSISRARKVRSKIVASYCNILKVSQVLAFSTLGRCSFPFYRRMEGAPRLTYGITRVHGL